jgi:hypothetical protein
LTNSKDKIAHDFSDLKHIVSVLDLCNLGKYFVHYTKVITVT